MKMGHGVQILLDKQAILELLYRYARGWDRYDLDLLLDCFHPDAVVEQNGQQGRAHDLITGWFKALVSRKSMTHLITNALIEVKGDIAISEAHFFSHHRRAATRSKGELDWFIKGRYLDRFERRDGQWRIAARTGLLEFERLVEPADPELMQLPLSQRGRRKPDDPLYALLDTL